MVRYNRDVAHDSHRAVRHWQSQHLLNFVQRGWINVLVFYSEVSFSINLEL